MTHDSASDLAGIGQHDCMMDCKGSQKNVVHRILSSFFEKTSIFLIVNNPILVQQQRKADMKIKLTQEALFFRLGSKIVTKQKERDFETTRDR